MNLERLNAVKQFVENYRTQDNLSTAWPFAYVVQEIERRPVPDGCGEMQLYSASGWDIYAASKEDMLEAIRQVEPKFQGDPEDYEQVSVHDYIDDWVDVQWFFTKAEAEAYLGRDSHNLKSPRLYVKHLRRNTEATLILSVLFEVAGLDYEKEPNKG